MAHDSSFSFQVPFACGHVDEHNAVIHGVSMITGNLTAEGHELEVDATTLRQVFDCAVKAGQVPVKLNHGSGIEWLNGYLDNFHIDGDKVRGDWHLLKSHDETPKMLERATRQPGTFGLSVAFKGGGERVAGGKKAARCTKLLATDCVTAPAANPGGLFSARRGSDDCGPRDRGWDDFGAMNSEAVDTRNKGIMDNPTNATSQASQVGEPQL